VLCRMGGVGTWVLLLYAMSRLIYLDLRYLSYVCRNYMYMYTYLINIQCAILHKCSFYTYSGLTDLRLYKI